MESVTYWYKKKTKIELLCSYKTSYLTQSITYIEEIFIVCVSKLFTYPAVYHLVRKKE